MINDKIPVAILGATGIVGQRFLSLLQNHPWFKVVALCASDRSVGVRMGEFVIQPCTPNLNCKIVFSALDASVAGPIELEFKEAGYTVITNARNHRMDPTVPLLVPEVNGEYLDLVSGQSGCIIANPNCSTIGLVLALKPLYDAFGIEAAHVVTLQAISGAGAGAALLDIEDNVIPFISGEEDKIENEPLKILGQPARFADIKISAQCNRVCVSDGHMECVSLKLKREAELEEIIAAWEQFKGLKLPSAPQKVIHYFHEDNFPQTKHHRNVENGMGVSIGRLQKCPVLGIKFVLLSHNTIRGAAGGAILCAEQYVKCLEKSQTLCRLEV